MLTKKNAPTIAQQISKSGMVHCEAGHKDARVKTLAWWNSCRSFCGSSPLFLSFTVLVYGWKLGAAAFQHKFRHCVRMKWKKTTGGLCYWMVQTFPAVLGLFLMVVVGSQETKISVKKMHAAVMGTTFPIQLDNMNQCNELTNPQEGMILSQAYVRPACLLNSWK